MSAPESREKNVLLQGIGISPGLALGRAFVYQDILHRDHEYYYISHGDIDEEYGRIERSLTEVEKELTTAADRTERTLDRNLADIFRSQITMLQDPTLVQELRGELEQELVNAEQVVKRVFRRWERRFRDKERERMAHIADDMADLSGRLLRTLMGVQAHLLEDVPEGSILVARRLLPSDTVFLSRRSTRAVVVEQGGPGSHAALLTREMGIPAVGQVADLWGMVDPDDFMLVDGTDGKVVVRPDEEMQSTFRKRMVDLHRELARVRERRHHPAVTKDSLPIEVLANIGCRDDLELAMDNGADGIGLYRIENAYLARTVLPSEEELFDELAYTLTPVGDGPITVRLLDVGGDKTLPFLSLPEEPNPFLGRRGIRLLMEYPDLLRAQLRTFLRLAQEFNLRILVPMVTLTDEMEHVRATLYEASQDMGITSLPPLGAMIETPAAALCTAEIARHADFISIGTNDLTQYTMAAGRENPMVSQYFMDAHPAVMRLVEIIMKYVGDKPVCLCGELAGKEEALEDLLRLGIRSLSVAPPRVPLIKNAVRTIRVGKRRSASQRTSSH